MRIFLIFLAVLVLAHPAMAQSKKELAAQNAALAERVALLESRLLTGDPAAERLMQRVDALEASQRTLTGEVERLRYERDNLRAEVEALSGDIRILEELATRTQIHLDAAELAESQQDFQSQQDFMSYGDGGNGDESYAGDPELSGVPGAPEYKEMTIPVQEEYEQLKGLPMAGKQKLAEGNFSGAQSDFLTYVSAIPDAADAGEINFLLGETYRFQGAHADAADAYIESLKRNSSGSRAPEAMIRLAGSLRELGKTTEACRTLDNFTSQYPNAAGHVRDKYRLEQSKTGC